jgi:phytoene desaturase
MVDDCSEREQSRGIDASMSKVVIIGAGLGGLASAVRLANAGFDVRVLEKEPGPGGRCSSLRDRGFRWDIGPTILLFPDVLRALFRDCGADPADYLELSVCDPNYRIHFPDASTLKMSANLRAMQAELERLAPGSFKGYLSFLEHGRAAKETAFSTFLSRTYDSPAQMLGRKELMGIVKTRSYRSLYSVVSGLVGDERVRMALTFQAMYLGLSPYEAPALFGLLPYTEVADGVWYAKGGLGAISEALARLATERGVRIDYGVAAASIAHRGDRASAVVTASGERVPADVVLANADLPYVRRVMLQRPMKRAKFTSSGLMFFWGATGHFPEVLHHNVFFGRNYAGSFRKIFDEARIPEEPSFYVANAAHSDATIAPEGKSALYVLVPVPHLSERGPDWTDSRTISRVREHVLSRLDRTVASGLAARIEVEHVMTPVDWQRRFSLEHGSAFGLAHTLMQVGALRPPNRDAEVKNLYFVGASTQPATGIPNVLIGAMHVSDRIAREHASAQRAEVSA